MVGLYPANGRPPALYSDSLAKMCDVEGAIIMLKFGRDDYDRYVDASDYDDRYGEDLSSWMHAMHIPLPFSR